MDNLRTSLEAFSPDTHDVSNPDGTWNIIRLHADSLILDFTTALTLEGEIDQESRRAVAKLLQMAVDIMPADVHPNVVENIQNGIADVLLADEEET